MAIEQSAMDQFDSIVAMRNAPTPNYTRDDEELDINSYDFSGNAFKLESTFGQLQPNQTIVFAQTGATAGTSQMQYGPISDTGIPVAHFNVNGQFPMYGTPSAIGSQVYYDSGLNSNDLVLSSGRESVVSKLSSRKDKCMSRNAIVARENREKKKNEVHSLRARVSSLEEENAFLKKRYHDVKDAYKNDHERLKYLESVFSYGNLQAIGPMVEHMKNLPAGGEKAAKLKKKLSNLQFASGNPGICFHVKSSQEMTIRFCETCNGTSSSKKT